MTEEILKIGHVMEVDGSQTIGELDANIDDLYRTYKSRKYAIGQVGSIVKIVSGDVLIFGIVTSLRMEENPVQDPSKNPKQKPAASTDNKRIEIELIGEGKRIGLSEDEFEFQRGVSSYPLPGHDIYIASIKELKRIYARPDKPGFRIGTISQAVGLPVYLNTDDLIGKHFAILGTTGSGKSCAVALILRSLITEYPKAHIIVLDPHNEYSKAFATEGESIDISKLELPHWLLNLQESIDLYIGKTENQATRQTNIIKEAILAAKKAFAAPAIPKEQITVDTPTPYTIDEMLSSISASMPLKQDGKPSADAESHIKIINKIKSLQDDSRYSFLITPKEKVQDNLAELLSKYLRIPSNNKPISIIDLSGIPSDIVEVVVSVLCRIIFDFSLWNPKKKELPLLLVCEEAHRYASKGDDAEFKTSKKALARIAKEGRKYGVGMALVTQRPSELDPSILSQCNTILALRMSNETDQAFVSKALPDSLKSLVSTLSALRTREALVVGEGISVPLRAFFDELEEKHRPMSENVPYAISWKDNDGTLEDVKAALLKWRTQQR